MPRLLAALGLLLCLSLPAHAEALAVEQTKSVAVQNQTPLDQPNMDDAALLSWAVTAVTDAMTFTFNNYEQRQQESSAHFTNAGWETFKAQIQRARIIDSVTAMQQTVTAAPHSAPVLIQKGALNGKYRWLVRLRIDITFTNASATRHDPQEVTLVIESSAAPTNPDGIGIAQWVSVKPSPDTPPVETPLPPIILPLVTGVAGALVFLPIAIIKVKREKLRIALAVVWLVVVMVCYAVWRLSGFAH